MAQETISRKKTTEDRIESMPNFDKWVNFVEANKEVITKECIAKGQAVWRVNFEVVEDFDQTIAEELLDRPKDSISQFMHAANQVLKTIILPRFKELPDSYKCALRDLRKEHLGKLVSVRGYLVKADYIKPYIVYIKYVCPNCGAELYSVQEGDYLVEPTCSCGRKEKFMEIERQMTDSQVLMIKDEFRLRGDALMLPVFLRDDLVTSKYYEQIDSKKSILIQVNGILDAKPKEIQGKKIGRVCDFIIDTNSITEVKQDE